MPLYEAMCRCVSVLGRASPSPHNSVVDQSVRVSILGRVECVTSDGVETRRLLEWTLYSGCSPFIYVYVGGETRI